MRPLYLSIKGFGPYIKTEISEENFSLLNSCGLFLISGEIGAGKTTLFDAMVYALFGEASVKARPARELISHLLYSNFKNRVFPEISFKFFLDGRTYQITRRLPFEGVSEKVSLWIDGSLVSTNKKEVNSKIKELIGLEPKQFKKVFLIPQGEYREILLAKGKERKQLFEGIFETAFYASLEEFLKEKRNTLREELKIITEKIKSMKTLLGITSEEEFFSLYQELQEKERRLSLEKEKLVNKKQILEKEIKELEKTLETLSTVEKLKKELNVLNEKVPLYQEKKELIKKLDAFQQKLPYYKNLKILWKELRNLTLQKKKIKEELNLARQELTKLKKDEETIMNKEQEIESLKQKLHELERLEKVVKDLKTKKALKESLEKEVSDLEKEITLLENEKKDLTKELEKLSFLLGILKDLKELMQKEREINERLSLIERKKSLQKKLKTSENRLYALKEKVSELKKEKERFSAFSEAEKLLEFLKPGEPCPLCGAKEHPSPLSPSENFKKLQQIKKSLENEETNLKNLEKECNQLKGMLRVIEEKVGETEEKELLAEFSETKKQIIKNLAILKNYLKDMEENLPFISRLYDSFSMELEDTLKELKSIEKKLEEKKGAYLTKKGRLNSLEGALNEIKKIWGERLRDPEEEIKKIRIEVKNFEKRKKHLEEQIKQIENKILQNKEKLFQIKDFIRKRTKEYKETFAHVFSLIKNGIFQSLKELKQANELLNSLSSLKNEVEAFYREKERLEKNLQELKEQQTSINLNIEEIKTVLNEKRQSFYETESALQKLMEEIGKIKNREEELLRVKNELEASIKSLRELEKSFQIIEHLSSLVLGKNSLKISFHSYVLSTFIKLILERANKYFQDFSFGRYKFISNEVLKKDFNLEVFDIYTGKSREVRTLSGGESFIATLSLALGTSDVILRLSRSRPFESLFIDEGFGSLDTGTLEKVINTLITLGQKSGRIIGIISHLEELKKRFPVVLEVKKNPIKGSEIKLIRNI